MFFILLFVLFCVAFPLSFEIAKNGKNNILVKSSNQAAILMVESGKIVIGYAGNKGKFFIKPIISISINIFSGVNEYIRITIMTIIGLFCLYFVFQLIIWILGLLILLVTWLFL